MIGPVRYETAMTCMADDQRCVGLVWIENTWSLYRLWLVTSWGGTKGRNRPDRAVAGSEAGQALRELSDGISDIS
jgi:hypothetical protein